MFNKMLEELIKNSANLLINSAKPRVCEKCGAKIDPSLGDKFYKSKLLCENCRLQEQINGCGCLIAMFAIPMAVCALLDAIKSP